MGVLIDLCKLSYSGITSLFRKKDVFAELAKERRLQYTAPQPQQQQQQPIDSTQTIINNKVDEKKEEIKTSSISTTESITNINTKVVEPITTTNSNNILSEPIDFELKSVKGVGPVTIKELNLNGIYTASSLSKLTDQECDKLKPKIKKINYFRSVAQSMLTSK